VPKPFDASAKFLIELRPEDWLQLLKLPIGPVRVIDTDVSTVTAAGDRIFRVGTVPPYGAHFEFQAGPDSTLATRTWQYNVLYTVKLTLPVVSTLLLLRPFSNHQKLTGQHLIFDTLGRTIHDFRYDVVRVWEMPPEVFLSGGISLLPLATVAKVRTQNLPEVLEQIDFRLERDAKPSDAERIRMATFVLLGLKHSRLFVEKLMSRSVLELSSTYQSLLNEGHQKGMEEGREEGSLREARAMLVRAARRRLGEPSAGNLVTLDGMTSVAELETLMDRLFDVASWMELLAK
jgi:predicted transposase YdaD